MLLQIAALLYPLLGFSLSDTIQRVGELRSSAEEWDVNKEAKSSYMDWKPRPKLECIRRLSIDVMNDEEIQDSSFFLQAGRAILGRSNDQPKHTGEMIIYKIANYPMCSELTELEVEMEIDSAAETWNKVSGANVLLVNINSVESNLSEQPDADLVISFEHCQHKKYRDDPFSDNEDFGKTPDECAQTFGHEYKSEYIHLNTLMTWTDKSYTVDEIQPGDLQKPNLYTIALHEFGHALELSHSEFEEDVMHDKFAGDRKYRRLTLSENDKARLVEEYPVRSSCRDNPRHAHYCADESFGVCNRPELRSSCNRTCGICNDCDEPVADEYMKCTEGICADKDNELRPFCKKTCKLCEAKQCETLPDSLSMLTPATPLPILVGAEVTLQCPPNTRQKGDRVITCQSGGKFSWNKKPSCIEEPGGMVATTDYPRCADIRKNCIVLLARRKKNCRQRSVRRACKFTCGLCNFTTI